MYGFTQDDQQAITKALNITNEQWQQQIKKRHENLKKHGQTTLFDLPIKEWYDKARFQAKMNSGLNDIDTPELVLQQLGFSDIEIEIIKSKQ